MPSVLERLQTLGLPAQAHQPFCSSNESVMVYLHVNPQLNVSISDACAGFYP